MYAFLKGMQQIPQGLFTKLCICIDELGLMRMIDSSLRNMSENAFRSIHTGKLNKDLETSMQINKELRMRQDLTLRLKYVPNDIGVEGMHIARKMSIKSAYDATEQSKRKKKMKN